MSPEHPGPGEGAIPDGPLVSLARRNPAVAPTLVVAALLALATWVGRGVWFFSDDWNIYADYHFGNLTEPFNGHLSAVPAGIYQLLFHTTGVASYVPYRLCGLAVLAVLGYQVARWSLTRVPPLLAVVAVAAVMWNSSGSTNVMFPFLMNFSLPIAALVAIWWHLDRVEGGRPPLRHLAAAGTWLALALATSGLGVVAAVAVATELALRRAPWRTWAAFAPAVVVWSIWWLGHRGANELSGDPGAVLAYATRMLWAGTTSIAAGWRWIGALVGVAVLGAVVALTLRDRRLDPRVAAALAAAGAFAGLTALTRQDTVPPVPPDELRYGWTIGAYLVLAGVAVAHAWFRRPADGRPGPGSPAATRIALRSPATATAMVAAISVLALGALRLGDGMVEWADQVREAAPGLRSNVYAAEAAGAGRLGPDAVIRPLSFVLVTADAYLGAVADVGSPLRGARSADIGGRPDQREAADRLFFGAVDAELALAADESPAAGAPGCGTVVEALPTDVVLVRLPSGGGTPALSGPVVELSRFADNAAVRLRADPAGGSQILELPADAPVGTDAPVPYTVRGLDGVEVCTTG